jgi:hypothetical protein
LFSLKAFLKGLVRFSAVALSFNFFSIIFYIKNAYNTDYAG